MAGLRGHVCIADTVLYMVAIDIADTAPFALLAIDERFRVRAAAGADLAAYGWPTRVVVGQDLCAAIGAQHQVAAAIAAATATAQGLLATDAGPLRYVLSANGDGTYSLLLLPQAADSDTATKLVRDALTGAATRDAAKRRVQQAIAACAAEPHSEFALLFVDLDQFKMINDGLGHAAGDEVLRQVVQRLQDCVRSEDLVARFGGDEFVVVLGHNHDRGEANKIAERIGAALAAPFTLADGEVVQLSASIGIALGNAASNPDDLLRDADMAMYHAKTHGRGRFAWFTAPMHERAVARLRLESELRTALREGQFRVVYQPILSLSDGRLAGFEALLRWQHPQRGELGPDAFLLRAIDMGIIGDIDRWMFRAVAEQRSAWSRSGILAQPQWISVNLSEAQFHSADLISDATQAIHASSVDPEQLKFEITEGVFLDDADRAFATMMALRRLQVRLVIDDFGTGYSSLSYLHRFPHLVESLKVDRSFVAGIEQEVEKAEIIRAVVQLGRNLGLSVVAEGIENSRQLRQLVAMRCDFGQGYYFARPLASSAVPDFVAAGTKSLLGFC